MSLRQRSCALFTLMFLSGFGLASWITRTPTIRDLVHASPSDMGVILLGLATGSILGILVSGKITAKFGARPVIVAAMLSIILSMPIIGASANSGSGISVAFGLLIFGLGMGGAGVALDVEGAEVERLSRRAFLPLLHGFNSLGTLVGALVAVAFNGYNIDVAWHLILIGAISVALFFVSIKFIPTGTGKNAPIPHPSTSITRSLWLDYRLLTIGFMALAMTLAEGAANDWLPLVMVDGYGFSEASSSLIFAGFGLSMTLGRFCGAWFINRYGEVAVFRTSALLGAIGVALVIFVEIRTIAGVAVILWGLGTSLTFPLAISAASRSGPNPAARVSIVAMLGYSALLVGPPLLGFAAEHNGLKYALIIPLLFIILAVVLSPFIATKSPETSTRCSV